MSDISWTDGAIFLIFFAASLFLWSLNGKLNNFCKIRNLARFTPSFGQLGRPILKGRYLVKQQPDFLTFLQRVTYPWSLNGELSNLEQNSNLAQFTPSISQSDHSILKSRYLVNLLIFWVFAASYIYVIFNPTFTGYLRHLHTQGGPKPPYFFILTPWNLVNC